MNSIINTFTKIAAALIAISATCQVCAECQSNNDQGQSQNDQRPARHEPPAQAYTDCKGKKVGEAVQINTPRGDNVSATCTDSAKGLFARPVKPPRDQDDQNSSSQQKK